MNDFCGFCYIYVVFTRNAIFTRNDYCVILYSYHIQLIPSFIKDSKSMQDGWGESDGPVTGTRHSSWEEEDDGGVWNTAGSQGSTSSHNSANWGQGGKKQMKVVCLGNIWACLFIYRRQSWEFFSGRSRAAGVPEVLSKRKIFSWEQITASSVPLMFLPQDFETTDHSTVAMGTVEFSKIDCFSF